LNILFLAQVLPYPIDAGPKVRGYYNLRYLADKHAVTLLSFVRPTDSSEALSHLKSFCTRVETIKMPRSRVRDGLSMVKSLLSSQPFLITRDEVPEMDLTLRKLIREKRFDAIHADQLWMAPYALKAKREAIKNGYHPRIILDQHNAVYLIPKRMAEASKNRFLKTWLKRESKLMAEFETQTCRQFDHIVWVTQEDLKAVSSIASLLIKDNLKVAYYKALSEDNSIIPICVDPAETAPVDRVPEADEILFVGGMHWPPNADGVTWFAKEVLPLVTKERPQSRFVAVGKQPPEAITAMGQQVFTPGYVENIDRYWANARVFVVPLRAGGGMRVKILDAWARGIPIVSTTIGAEGITYNSGTDILIADTPEEFSRAVSQVLIDNDLAKRLSQYGRETLENHYDWKKVYPAWDRVYNPAFDSNNRQQI
jgi:glycosyltransferase involved in cell wall biosynthesis